jgi:Starch synthase catalytic domain
MEVFRTQATPTIPASDRVHPESRPQGGYRMSDARPNRRRILMLSWEYPPLLVGGLGRHVHALATTLAAEGHQVTVVTRHMPGAPVEEHCEGVHVVRAPDDPPTTPSPGRPSAPPGTGRTT